MTPVIYDCHMHTPLCNHAEGHPREYAETALAGGLKGIIFTCHSPMPNQWSAWARMKPDEYDEYLAMIQVVRDEFEGRLDVRVGLESDFFPGMEDWLKELHEKAPLNLVLGSVHYQLHDYLSTYWKDDILAFQKQYYEHLAESAETGLFDVISHSDLVKNKEPEAWDFNRMRDDIERCLDRIAKTGVAMEINTSGVLKALPEFNPGLDQLALMKARDIPVTLGSDSHVPERPGDGFVQALKNMKSVGYTQVSHFIDRQRIDTDIGQALASLGE